jgi:tetratricopeptide (TPR) repeat protein
MDALRDLAGKVSQPAKQALVENPASIGPAPIGAQKPPTEDAEARKRLALAAAEAQSAASLAIERAQAVGTELERLVRDAESALRGPAADEGKGDRHREVARRVREDRGRLAEAYKGNERLSRSLAVAIADVQTGRNLLREYPDEAAAKFRKAAEAAGVVEAWWRGTRPVAARAEEVRERAVDGTLALAGLLPGDPYQAAHRRLDGWWQAVQEGDAAGQAQVQAAQSLCDGLNTLLPRRRQLAPFAPLAGEGSEFGRQLQSGDRAITSGDLGAAAAAYSMAEERLKIEEPEFRGKRAIAALRNGDLDLALGEASRWTELAPREPAPLVTRARICLAKEDWAGALRDAQAAVGLSPTDEAAYLPLARAYIGRRDYSPAERACSTAIERNPKLAEAYIARSRVRMAVGRGADAIQDASKAIELLPDSAEALATRAAAYQENWMNDKAIADCIEAIEVDRSWTETYAVLAKAHAQKRDYGAALKACEWLLELRPKDPKSFTLRATILIAKRDYAGAVADATRALDLDTKNVPALLERGRAQTFLGKSTEALLDLNTAIKSDPQNPTGYSYRSFVLGRPLDHLRGGDDLARLEACEADISRAIELSPTAEYIERRGEWLLKRHNWNTAYLSFRKAEDMRPSPRSRLRIGQIYGFCTGLRRSSGNGGNGRDPVVDDMMKKLKNYDNNLKISESDLKSYFLSFRMTTESELERIKAARRACLEMSILYLNDVERTDPNTRAVPLSKASAYYRAAESWYSLKDEASFELIDAKERYAEAKKEDDDWVRESREVHPEFRKARIEAGRLVEAERKRFRQRGPYHDIELIDAALAEMSKADQIKGDSDDSEYGYTEFLIKPIVDKNYNRFELSTKFLKEFQKQALELNEKCR